MATGGITSLGLGSGLDLQNILDQLREVDQAQITAKENEKIEMQDRMDAYNTVNAKLFAMKSDALNLSLASNFLSNSVSSTDEDVITATAVDGLAESSHTIEVIQKARKNSWESAAVDSKSAVMFTEPATGISEPTTDAAVSEDTTLTFYYGEDGSQEQIDVALTAGMTLADITDAVNGASGNRDTEGEPRVEASFVLAEDGSYYIRLAAASGGNTLASEITVEGFDWIAADTTVSIGQGENSMVLSVPPGTSYQEMANLINGAEDNPGVTAAMIDNGDADNPYQLTLVSDDTGEASRLTLTHLDGLTEVTGAGAESLNAEFTINGITYARQANSGISDVIDGVTFDLNNTGEATLNIEVSHESV